MSRKCRLCKKENAKACCGKCKAVFYCNRECQVKHWNVHKLECKTEEKTESLNMNDFDFTLPSFDNECIDIRNTTKYGYGMFAKCDIKRGTIICTEKALLVLPEFAKAKMAFYINQQFLLLSKTQQNIYKSLSSKSMDKNSATFIANDNIKLLSIFVNNQIAIKEGQSSCIFPLISRVNHCCINNAHWVWNETQKQLRLIALNDIHKEEEILVNYCVDVMLLDQRKKRLKSGWNFACECMWCKVQKVSVKMDVIFNEYLTSNETLESLIAKPLEGYKASQKLVKIVEKHMNANPELLHKHLYDTAQFALGLQKWSEASYYLETAMKQKQIARGCDIEIESEFMAKVHLLPTKFRSRFRKFDPKFAKKMNDKLKQVTNVKATSAKKKSNSNAQKKNNGKTKANQKPNGGKAKNNKNNKTKNSKAKKKKKKTRK